MSISSEDRKDGPFVGNDVAVTFPFAFKVFSANDVLVVKQTVSTGAEEILELTTDYTVTLNPNQDISAGGSVVLVDPLETGKKMIISSKVPNLQPTVFTNAGGFFPANLNTGLDRATIQIQQQTERLNRALVYPITDAENIETELPAAQIRAEKVLSFDENGAPVTEIEAADIAAAVPSAAAATAAAAAAAASAAAALASQNAAAASEAVAEGIVNNGNIVIDRFSGDGSNTTFVLSGSPVSENNTQVYISGVYQQKNTYSLAGSTITFDVAPALGTNNIEVVWFQPFGVSPTVLDGSITTGKLADGAVTIDKIAASVLALIIPSGAILQYAGDGSTPPTGFLYCDGAQVSRTTFANLFAAIGTKHGSGNGSTTFHLPDYRGRFLRGVSGTSGRDLDAGSRTAMNSGGNTGNNVGSVQAGQIQTHTHTVSTTTNHDGLTTFDDKYPANGGDGGGFNTPTSAWISIGSTGGNETRPINAYVNFIIKT